MLNSCIVAVGSLNPVKVRAVERAFRLLCKPKVLSFSVSSGVSKQPIGICEIVKGALNRAIASLELANASYGVGIEAGLIELLPNIDIEVQVAIIVDNNNKASIGLSQGFLVPEEWAGEMKEVRIELEEIVEKAIGIKRIGENIGLIGYLTKGLITRAELAYGAVLAALIPWLNPNIYKERLVSLKLLRESVNSCI